MANIQKVVKAIQDECHIRRVDVSAELAAFVARTVIFDNADKFVLSGQLSKSMLTELVHLSSDRLCERESPSLETIKMQVAFDTTYGKRLVDNEETARSKLRKLSNLARTIVNLRAADDGDYETFTTLYRHIFTYVKEDINLPSTGASDREVAAALESVFPRVSLKAFVQLAPEDKRRQLGELANIVLGIRIFNKEIGKGGKDLVDVENECVNDAEELLGQLGEQLQQCQSQCEEYVDALMYAIYNDEGRTAGLEGQVPRWQTELANRRQLVAYIQTLKLETATSFEKIKICVNTHRSDVDDLKRHIGGKNSVSKEVVYPKFDIVARNWKLLYEEYQLLQACRKVLDTLLTFRHSFEPSLSPELVVIARKAALAAGDRTAYLKAEAEEAANDQALDAAPAQSDDSPESESTVQEQRGGAPAEPEDESDTIFLSPESTADIANLDFMYNGFCPVTLVDRRGLLLHGTPDVFGAVNHKDKFYAFASELYLRKFMRRPEKYLEAVRHAVQSAPELISVLSLRDEFPEIVGTSKRSSGGSESGVHPLMASSAPQMVDAGTATPTHFVEKKLDYNYSWNEWDLRRRAVQYANIRKSTTTAQQTTSSHFRATAATQVFQPRDQSTMTGISKGTNPIRSHNYIAGLRGGPVHDFEKGRQSKSAPAHVSQFARRRGRDHKGRSSALGAAAARVLNMSFEP